MTEQIRFPDDRDTLTAPLPDEAEHQERAERLLAGPVVSLHDHPVRFPEPFTKDAWTRLRESGRDVLGVEELERSPLDVVISSALGGPRLDLILSWAEGMREDIEAAEGLILGTDLTALETAIDPGSSVTALYLGMEDLAPVGTDLDNIARLYELGVREAGIAYNTGTALGGGLAQDPDPGLSELGRQAVGIMNQIGMLVDVSHAGDRTALETAERTELPMIISHAGARGVWNSARMKPDDVIKAIAATGGVIGIEAAPGSTRTDLTHSRHDVDDVIAHLEYCAELVGVDHVGLGGDTFYGDHVGLYRAAGSSALRPEGAPPFDQDFVPGAENPTEVPIQIAYRLLGRGWRDEDVAKVLGDNALRVMRAGLASAH